MESYFYGETASQRPRGDHRRAPLALRAARGAVWGLHSTLAKYKVGNSRTRYNGWTTGIGSSVGYSWMLAKRWNLTLEGGVGIYYMDDLRWHPDPSPYEVIRYEHCRRVVLAPSKIEVAFSYLF